MAAQSILGAPSTSARRWWTVVTGLLLAAVFLEAVFAGAMLSGIAWALRAHVVTAAVLMASATLAALVAFLRRGANGARLSLLLAALAVLVLAQAAVGMMSAKGANLLWLHVPLGVALFGLARQAVMTTGQLKGE
jgi:hypothetical protein